MWVGFTKPLPCLLVRQKVQRPVWLVSDSENETECRLNYHKTIFLFYFEAFLAEDNV